MRTSVHGAITRLLVSLRGVGEGSLLTAPLCVLWSPPLSFSFSTSSSRLPSPNPLALPRAELPGHSELTLLSVTFLKESPAEVACSLFWGLRFPLCLQEIFQAFCGIRERNRTGRHLSAFPPSLHEAWGGRSQTFVRGWGEGFILRKKKGCKMVSTKLIQKLIFIQNVKS